MRPENIAEINKRYTLFFGAFLALLLFSLLCIFFLFRVHQSQLQRIGESQAALRPGGPGVVIDAVESGVMA